MHIYIYLWMGTYTHDVSSVNKCMQIYLHTQIFMNSNKDMHIQVMQNICVLYLTHTCPYNLGTHGTLHL